MFSQKLVTTVFLLTFLSGCKSDSLVAYLTKQGFHQGSLILRAEPISKLLQDPHIPQKTKWNLELVEELKAFAHKELGLKVGKNYGYFIDLKSDRVTTLVTAAEKFKFEPHYFEYPLFGKLPYKGFFDVSDARRLADKLKLDGLDVYVRPVEAFSTAGWLPDPVLSTMIQKPARLIELIFHELTHATFYFSNEADFNEAFASWMGYQGSLLFLENYSGRAIEGLSLDVKALQAELKSSYEFQMELAAVSVEIKAEAEKFYKKMILNSESVEKDRIAFFELVRAKFAANKNDRVKHYAKVEWNNASLLAMGTYYFQIPKIENYAKARGLGPKEFLAIVKKTGPEIIKEILR